MNRLSNERSPYLLKAADQAIDWYPWCDEAFERARHEDKPIFISSGAIWCHWCHVMASESFDDHESAKILNEKFICIKLDRDERPDIDHVYQLAVAAMVGAGGWPLSVFLTPEAKPFYGGSYFPLSDSVGRSGFRSILRKVAEIYVSKKGDVSEYANNLIDALKADITQPTDFDLAITNGAENIIVNQLDILNGGFGHAPKFPMTGAFEFLLSRGFFDNAASTGKLIASALTKIARGGIYDHLQGGFHRYSTDVGWIIPHFEKMADDNARLLTNYINLSSLFPDELFREVSFGVVRFLTEILSDPEGGFYASQDADVTPDDEGGYFTWTDSEFKAFLDKDEYPVLARYFLHGKGSMHHDPDRHVLFINKSIIEVAEEAGIPTEKAITLLHRSKEKLIRERTKRTAPVIDTTLYTSLNSLVITALLNVSMVLQDNTLKEKAFSSLRRIIKLRLLNGNLLHTRGVAAMLDDYIFLTEALVIAYEASSMQSWLDKAIEIMESCIAKLWDEKDGGFFDSETALLGIRLKSIEDTPHPSANSVAIRLLQKLHYLTDKILYKDVAEKALKAFYGKTSGIGLHWASYYSALDASTRTLVLTIHENPDSELAAAARTLYYPYKVIRYSSEGQRGIVPCVEQVCMSRIHTVQELEAFVRKLRNKWTSVGPALGS
jgi:uncharacterized protein